MKENKSKKAGLVAGAALALAAALSVGTVAFAATDTQAGTNQSTAAVAQHETDEYGNLTDSEITELERIYDRYDEICDAIVGDNEEMSEEEFLAAASQYQDEIEKLEAQEYELEKKAGIYGDLTEDEIAELEGIYERYEAIYEAAFGDNEDSMTDEELEAAIAPYEEELEKLESREYELEKKAGWYGDLTDEEISQLESLYDQADGILEKAIGDNEDITDDELESVLTQYQDELESLEKQIDELEQKAGFGGSEE